MEQEKEQELMEAVQAMPEDMQKSVAGAIYTREMAAKLWAMPEDKREVLAAHMLGIVEGVKIAQAMEKKSA